MHECDEKKLKSLNRWSAEEISTAIPTHLRFVKIVFFGLVVVGLITKGATEQVVLSMVAVGFGFITAICLVYSGEPIATKREFRISIILIVLLSGMVVAQSIPTHLLSSPAWNELSRIIKKPYETISVAPNDSINSIPSLILPFQVFITTLILFPTDREALRTASLISTIGGLLSIVAIIEFTLSPDTLLLSNKYYYLDSLTAPFVNRNTAGTFYGIVSIILVGRVVVEYRGAVVERRTPSGVYTKGRAEILRLWYLGMLLMCSSVALFLSKSRGATAATFLAFLVIIPLLSSGSKRESNGGGRFGSANTRYRYFVKVLALSLAICFVGIIFADRALFRAEVQGLDDGRICVATAAFRAASDNLWTGVGFATFRVFFPAYRDAKCGVYGIWDRAHSVYLEGYLGLGMMFVVALLVGIGTFFLAFWHGLRTRRRMRVYAALGISALLLVLAHSIVDFSVQIPGFSIVFAAIMGSLVTISRTHRSIYKSQ